MLRTGDRWFEFGSLQQTVGVSLDFSFLYPKAGSCRGVRGPAGRYGRQRRVGLVNITPTAGNISVEPFSSTALPARRIADRGCTGAPERTRAAAGLSDVTRR